MKWRGRNLEITWQEPEFVIRLLEPDSNKQYTAHFINETVDISALNASDQPEACNIISQAALHFFALDNIQIQCSYSVYTARPELNICDATSEMNESLTQMIHNAIERVDTQSYSQAELEEWKSSIDAFLLYEHITTLPCFVLKRFSEIVGFLCLNPEQHKMEMLFVDPRYQGRGYAHQLTEHALLMSQQWPEIKLNASRNAVGFYKKYGFQSQNCESMCRSSGTKCTEMIRSKSLYPQSIMNALSRLNIDPMYCHERQLPFFEEAPKLESLGHDVFEREQQATPETVKAFQAMCDAAQKDNIQLQLISAYRGFAYQTRLIENKIANGLALDDILKVNAPPGFSEHHSGCALDLSCEGYPPLESNFAESPAFQWLTQNAHLFGFSLSYPENNPTEFCFEPWHWCFQNN